MFLDQTNFSLILFQNIKTMLLQDLNHNIIDCDHCQLSAIRKHAVIGQGNSSSDMMLIGQSPGKVEDELNRLFVGPSGQIFDKLLVFAGITRDDIYLTNLIKCILPKSRRPSQNEIKKCTYYLDREIEIVNPRFIVPLGFHSTRYIPEKYGLEKPDKHNFHKLFGKPIQLKGLIIYPLRHPTALFFNPSKEDIMKKNYSYLNILLKTES